MAVYASSTSWTYRWQNMLQLSSEVTPSEKFSANFPKFNAVDSNTILKWIALMYDYFNTPSMMHSCLASSPSLQITSPRPNSRWNIHSTISMICAASKLWRKSLSRMASLINSFDLFKFNKAIHYIGRKLQMHTHNGYYIDKLLLYRNSYIIATCCF